MGAFRIEPNQIFHQFHIELFRSEEFVGMKVHELLLDCPVEPFAVRIHLRRSRIGVVMGEMQFPKTFCEVLLELRIVVCEHILCIELQIIIKYCKISV